jgi:hypothetical protein
LVSWETGLSVHWLALKTGLSINWLPSEAGFTVWKDFFKETSLANQQVLATLYWLLLLVTGV